MPSTSVRVLLRVGGLLHRFRRWELAGRCYARAAALAPGEPEPAYRLGVVRHRAGDLPGAQDAYAAALAAGPADPLPCLRRRVEVDRELGDDEALADDLARLARERPEPKRWRELVRVLERLGGRTPELVEALDGAAATGRERVEDLIRRAALKAEIADWSGALELYRQALKRRPGSRRLRLQAASSAEWLHRSPLRVVGGTVVPADAAERSAGLAEAAELLRSVCDDGAGATAHYRLGRVLERDGRLEEAAETYQRAVDLAEAADKVWSEVKMAAWGFRRDYVRAASSGTRPQGRLALSVRDGEPLADLAEAGGVCEFSIGRYGLSMRGFVLHGAGESVTVHVDGEPLLSSAVDRSAWRPTFRASLKHQVLETLGESAVIAVTVGARAVVTASGAVSVRLENPHGTGRYADLRAAGRTVGKKGYWSAPPPLAARREERFVAAYARLAQFMDHRFGRSLFLMYGTLLGCHRDGRLISGDDDFDVGYLARGATPEEVKADSVEMMRACLAAGFDVGVGGEGRPFNVRLDGCELDVNPVWFHQGRAHAFNAHDLEPEHFEPARSAELAGRKVLVPAEPEAFLADNYGPDWREPRSDFKYHRSKETIATLRRAHLRLSELRGLAEYASAALAGSEASGEFYGFDDEPFESGSVRP